MTRADSGSGGAYCHLTFRRSAECSHCINEPPDKPLTRTGNRVHSSAEYNRGWRAANMAAGNCRDCKLPRLPGRARCEKCLKLHAGWEADRRAKRALARANAENAHALSAGRVCLMPAQGSIGKTD